MGTIDGSPVAKRVAMAGQVLGQEGTYGLVTAVSQEVGVARQVYGVWRARVWEAERRALAVMGRPLTTGPGVVAFDELDGNDRQGASLSVVAARSGAVWQTTGPVGVDTESWTRCSGRRGGCTGRRASAMGAVR